MSFNVVKVHCLHIWLELVLLFFFKKKYVYAQQHQRNTSDSRQYYLPISIARFVHLQLKEVGLTFGELTLLGTKLDTPSLLESLRFTGISSVDADAGCLIEDEYLNRRYFKLRNNFISYDVRETHDEEQLESESVNEDGRCNRTERILREFKKRDVVQCLDSLSIQRNRRPMHIAFIGDSTVRQHFISFIEWIPNYDKKISRISTRYAEFKFHEDRTITFPLLDNLLVSFYWRRLIKDDLIADFKRWSSTDNHNRAPDFILLGLTAHHLKSNEVSDSLQKFEKLFTQTLLPLINASLTRHPHQEIVWLLQSPVIMEHMNKDLRTRDVNPPKIMKYNHAIRRIFKDTRVLIWDAMGAVVEEYLRTCALTRFQRSDKFWYTNCRDFIHPGIRAISIGTQLIINHICETSS